MPHSVIVIFGVREKLCEILTRNCMMPRAPRTECVGPSIQYIRAGRVPELERATKIFSQPLSSSPVCRTSPDERNCEMGIPYIRMGIQTLCYGVLQHSTAVTHGGSRVRWSASDNRQPCGFLQLVYSTVWNVPPEKRVFLFNILNTLFISHSTEHPPRAKLC